MQEANKEADRLANEALPQVDLHPHDQIVSLRFWGESRGVT